jgi:hypothetical protein
MALVQPSWTRSTRKQCLPFQEPGPEDLPDSGETWGFHVDTRSVKALIRIDMALLHEAVEKKKMDVRMVERNVNRGAVTQAEVDQAVKALPDDSENAIYISLESLANDLSGEGAGATHH